ncbi:hypothetical protein Arcpr_1441 [Archaeoglobus profundus DSM 5631]|uniref:Uncharacterized protein n=1 Tax=Archaeoglobus profundus (strain DSM 5631 / JCM 9629 / NBRC 100127 / Av18) TaxID=572546 RepID=D2REE5_ARCPA|nr:hypothetical protein Arcpr_1441 [Archaeoglobus profundus DSM 5631]
MDIDQILQCVHQYQTLIYGILSFISFIVSVIIGGSRFIHQKRLLTKFHRERWIFVLCKEYIEFERELFSDINLLINFSSLISSSIIYPLLSLYIINVLFRFEYLRPFIAIPIGFFSVPLIICVIIWALIRRKTSKSKDLDALKKTLSSSQKYYSHMLGITIWLMLVFVLLIFFNWVEFNRYQS